MNQGKEIKHWIDNGCDWLKGTALYEKYGKSKTLKKLFLNKPTRFYQDKLYSELLSIKIEAERALIITPSEVKVNAVPYEELPDKLKRLDKEKSALYMNILKTRTEIKKLLKLKYPEPQRIKMADALDDMAKTDRFGRLKPFSITYVSYNKRSGIGGQLLRFNNCFLKVVNNTGSRVLLGKKHYSSNQPDHWKNSTRNFTPNGSGDIKKFHIWLMFEYNGMEVVTSELG